MVLFLDCHERSLTAVHNHPLLCPPTSRVFGQVRLLSIDNSQLDKIRTFALRNYNGRIDIKCIHILCLILSPRGC